MEYEVRFRDSDYAVGSLQVVSFNRAIDLMVALSRATKQGVFVCEIHSGLTLASTSCPPHKAVSANAESELTADEILDAWREACREDFGG